MMLRSADPDRMCWPAAGEKSWTIAYKKMEWERQEKGSPKKKTEEGEKGGRLRGGKRGVQTHHLMFLALLDFKHLLVGEINGGVFLS